MDPLTDAEMLELRKLAKNIPDLEAELRASIRRADEAAGKWGQGPELRVKDLETQLGEAKKRFGDLEGKANQRIDELETRLSRGGAPSGKGPSPDEQRAMQAFGQFLRKGHVAPDLVKALATDDNTQGGYMVPAPLRAQIIEALVELSPIRANAAPLTITAGNALETPREDGEFEAGWTTERASRPATATGEFGMLTNALREQYAFPKVTQQMLDDAGFPVESYIARKIAERFAKLEGVAFLLGNGLTQPEGLLTNEDVPEVNSGHASQVTADGVLKLIDEIPTGYAQGLSLFMTRKTKGLLRRLKDNQGQYLWQPNLQASQPSTFAGVPIVETPDIAEVAANAKAILLTNWRRSYQIIDKATVGMLRDPLTDKPNVGFYTTRRVGGIVTLPTAAAIQKIAV